MKRHTLAEDAGNTKHDPKTGQFTSGGGGGSKSVATKTPRTLAQINKEIGDIEDLIDSAKVDRDAHAVSMLQETLQEMAKERAGISSKKNSDNTGHTGDTGLSSAAPGDVGWPGRVL